ncbi:hypothetical protein [Vagococcus fluvialis]|uniref:hypothetical protein n=1 Tax=Vagococcus fluvialis TaxID=2738 RepID=UPI0037D3D7C9
MKLGNSLWENCITYLFKCDHLDLEFFFSEDQFKWILEADETLMKKYFNDIQKSINKNSSNNLRLLFDYLYEDFVDTKTFLSVYNLDFCKTDIRKNIVECHTFCPCCNLHETSTGNSQMDHYIPRKLVPFYSIFHPHLDQILSCIEYSLNTSGFIEVSAVNPVDNDKVINYCKLFKIESRINALENFDNKKNKKIFKELQIFERMYLDDPSTFESNINKIFDYAYSEISQKEDFFVKIVCDILPSIKDQDGYLRTNIQNL